MHRTKNLYDLGQSLWLDDITRQLLASGKLRRFIDELGITGLTSNPTIFDQAIGGGSDYDQDIAAHAARGLDDEAIFYELALSDLTRAADLFRSVFDRTGGVDGWVSLEVSPRLAYDSAQTLKAAAALHGRADRPNLFIKIPGTEAGLKAIEDATFAGVPVNVTLLFSTEQYLAAAGAYMTGLERRIAAGLPPTVASVASLFVSRWDGLPNKPKGLESGRLGIGVAADAYLAYQKLLASPRWQRVFNAGARPQRLLFASTSTKDPALRDVLYIEALAAPLTVNTMPEKTLLAYADHGGVNQPLSFDTAAGYTKNLEVAKSQGMQLASLALELQEKGAKSFNDSWDGMLKRIAEKRQRSGTRR